MTANLLRMDERSQHPTPGSDRVTDGRQLMVQEDADPPQWPAWPFRVAEDIAHVARGMAIGIRQIKVTRAQMQRTGDQVV